MAIIIGGKEFDIPGRKSTNWKDDPRLRFNVNVFGEASGQADGVVRPRGVSPTIIVIHATSGDEPQTILPGSGAVTDGPQRTATYWREDPDGPKHGGAHLVVGYDGAIGQTADLLDVETWHASNPGVNLRSIGIEMNQIGGGHQRMGIYQATIDACADLVAFLCDTLKIERRVPTAYLGRPRIGLGANLIAPDQVRGVVGHRDCTDTRGRGCPGDAIMNALAARGFAMLPFGASMPIHEGAKTDDGLLTPAERAALAALEPTAKSVEDAIVKAVDAFDTSDVTGAKNK